MYRNVASSRMAFAFAHRCLHWLQQKKTHQNSICRNQAAVPLQIALLTFNACTSIFFMWFKSRAINHSPNLFLDCLPFSFSTFCFVFYFFQVRNGLACRLNKIHELDKSKYSIRVPTAK